MMGPSALDDALMRRQCLGQPAPRGRHPRSWPRWARRALGMTVGGLRVVIHIERRGSRSDVSAVGTALRLVLDGGAAP